MYKVKPPSLLTIFAIVQVVIVAVFSYFMHEQDRRLAAIVEVHVHSQSVLLAVHKLEVLFENSNWALLNFSDAHRPKPKEDKLGQKLRKDCEQDLSQRYEQAMADIIKQIPEILNMEKQHYALTGKRTLYSPDHEKDRTAAFKFMTEILDLLKTTQRFAQWDDRTTWSCSLASPYRSMRCFTMQIKDDFRNVVKAEKEALLDSDKQLKQIALFKQEAMLGMPISMLLCAIAFGVAQRRINRKRAQRVELLKGNIQGVADGCEPIPLSGDDDLAAIDQCFRAVSENIFDEQWKQHEAAWNERDKNKQEDLSSES